MNTITIDPVRCAKDKLCVLECPMNCIDIGPDGFPRVTPEDAAGCIGCGHCMAVCPHEALSLNGMAPERLAPAADPALGIDAIRRLLTNRRSVRIYRNEPVPRADIEALLDIVRWAPTAKNVQSIHWLAVDDPSMIREMARMCVDWLRQAGQMPVMTAGWDQGEDMILRQAPVVVMAHTHAGLPAPAGNCFIAATSLELAGAAMGLGSCWAGILMRAAQEHPPLREFLNLPDGHVLYAALMMGFPKFGYHRVPDRAPLRITWK